MTGSQSGTGKRIARVFPRRTRATPDDGLSFFGLPPLLDLPEIDEVHVSVAFTYDIPRAEALAYQWEQAGVPVRVGGGGGVDAHHILVQDCEHVHGGEGAAQMPRSGAVHHVQAQQPRLGGGEGELFGVHLSTFLSIAIR